MKFHLPLIIGTLSALGCLINLAMAQDGHDQRGPEPVARQAPHLQLDQRYRHDHYYPARGYAMHALPRGSISVLYGGGQFYFHGGVWFRPARGRFIVSVPPVGIVVPMLPPAYTTLWIRAVPYYYANGVYYVTTLGQGYTVVAPPPGAETAQAVPRPVLPGNLPDQVIYPKNGQSANQMESDRQDCNRWAESQPGSTSDASVFQRGIAACMEGRGYTVR